MSAMAWLGGAAFVASLGYLTYFYAVVLAMPGEATASVPWRAGFNVLLFSIFAAHHSLFARTSIKRWLQRLIPPNAERSTYVWLASALAAAMCVLWKPIPGVIYDVAGSGKAALWALQALGALIIIRAARVMDPLELAGIRQLSSSRSRADGELKVVGPFRVIRHPIYLGWMLLVFAAPLMTANRLLFAAVSSGYLILAIPWEEKSLAAAHGDRYREYQRAVRWRVLPGVW